LLKLIWLNFFFLLLILFFSIWVFPVSCIKNRILLNFPRIIFYQFLRWIPIYRNYTVVMLISMETQSKRNNLLFLFLLRKGFMKSFHWLNAISINFNRLLVNLTQGLYFDVVSPFPICHFFCNILIHLTWSTFDETWKVRSLCIYIFHAIDSYYSMIFFSSISLMRYWSE